MNKFLQQNNSVNLISEAPKVEPVAGHSKLLTLTGLKH